MTWSLSTSEHPPAFGGGTACDLKAGSQPSHPHPQLHTGSRASVPSSKRHSPGPCLLQGPPWEARAERACSPRPRCSHSFRVGRVQGKGRRGPLWSPPGGPGLCSEAPSQLSARRQHGLHRSPGCLQQNSHKVTSMVPSCRHTIGSQAAAAKAPGMWSDDPTDTPNPSTTDPGPQVPQLSLNPLCSRQ